MTEYDSSDDDIDYGRTKALPVAHFDTYDPSTAPVTGEEYLRRVQLEAEACPKTVVATNLSINGSIEKDNSSILYMPPDEGGFIASAKDRLPEDVQKQLVADFSRLRLQVDKKRNLISDEQKKRNRTYYPKLDKRSYWKRFSLGPDVSSDSEDEGGKLKKKVPPNPGNPPLKLLLSLDQSEVLSLLEMNTKWIKEYGFDPGSNGVWIYSLLSILEKPLPADGYAVLRDVSRGISVSRAQDDPDDKSTVQMSLIILLIGRYFDQLDLLD